MKEQVDFTGVESTMLTTLYLKALDGRSANPVLGDRFAAATVDKVDYDFDSLIPRGGRGNRFLVALRARQLDRWATDFLRRTPDATVLHLGCGLDSRAFRVDRPEGVRWYDVDLPGVIDVHRRLYPEPDGYRTIGAAVTESAWLDEIPAGGPVLIIAEGLLMYLTEDENRQLLSSLATRFPSGELLCDGLPSWVVRTSQRMSKALERKGYPPYSTAVTDGRVVEQWDPRFACVADISLLTQSASIPVAGYRAVYRMMNAIPPVRGLYRLFRFEF